MQHFYSAAEASTPVQPPSVAVPMNLTLSHGKNIDNPSFSHPSSLTQQSLPPGRPWMQWKCPQPWCAREWQQQGTNNLVGTNSGNKGSVTSLDGVEWEGGEVVVEGWENGVEIITRGSSENCKNLCYTATYCKIKERPPISNLLSH